MRGKASIVASSCQKENIKAYIWASQAMLVVKKPACNAGDIRDVGLIPGSGRFPWSRAWQLTPVFLPGEWTEEPRRLQSIGLQRVRHS